MSKRSKAAAKDIRLQKKRAIKNANKAKYASWKQAGENGKSQRSVKRKKGKGSAKGLHLTFCGNLACEKCFSHGEYHIVKRNSFLR